MRFPSIINEQTKIVGTVVLGIFLFSNLFAQPISDLKKEQAQLNEKIDFTKKLLSENKDKKVNTELSLTLLNKQIESRRLLVKSIGKELSNVRSLQLEREGEVKKLKLQKDHLVATYSDILRASYKSKLLKNRWLFLFTAHSMQQLYQRWRYLRQLNGGVQKQLGQLTRTVNQIDAELKSLKEIEISKEKLLKEEDREKKTLDQDLAHQRVAFNALLKEEKKLKSNLKAHRQAQDKLRKAIVNAIAAASK